MIEIIVILVVLGVLIKFIKFAWPLLLLSFVVFLWYMFPLYVTPIVLVLVVAGIYQNKKEIKEESAIKKIVCDAGLSDVDDIYEKLSEAGIDVTFESCYDYLLKLEGKGVLEIITLQDNSLVKSSDYKESNIILEVD